MVYRDVHMDREEGAHGKVVAYYLKALLEQLGAYLRQEQG